MVCHDLLEAAAMAQKLADEKGRDFVIYRYPNGNVISVFEYLHLDESRLGEGFVTRFTPQENSHAVPDAT